MATSMAELPDGVRPRQPTIVEAPAAPASLRNARRENEEVKTPPILSSSDTDPMTVSRLGQEGRVADGGDARRR